MTTDFYNLLLSDCALALVLLVLFWYVQRISRGLRGIATWGVAHLVYSLGAAMLDGTSQELTRSGDLQSAYWTAGIGGLLACGGVAGLAWSIIQFVRQRALNRWEWALMPLCLGFSLAGWIFWGTVDAQGAMRLSVADTGPGIAAADLPRILEPYGRTQRPDLQNAESTGLGLPLVKRMIEAHGGALEIDSAVGKGSIFTLRFPAARTLPGGSAAAAAA
jgi:hypothetical protein